MSNAKRKGVDVEKRVLSDVELTVYNGVDVVVCCVRHGGWGRGWRPQNMSEFK